MSDDLHSAVFGHRQVDANANAKRQRQRQLQIQIQIQIQQTLTCQGLTASARVVTIFDCISPIYPGTNESCEFDGRVNDSVTGQRCNDQVQLRRARFIQSRKLLPLSYLGSYGKSSCVPPYSFGALLEL